MTKGFLRGGFGALVMASVSVMAGTAHADNKAACLDATEKGQRLSASHHVVEAREQYLLCARSTCPSIVAQQCATWLVEAQRSLPTVVITAKDGAGVDLVDVTVTADGQPLVTRLDGEAVPVDPGRHAFHFALADGRQLNQQSVIKEGEKNQGLAVVLGGGKSAVSADVADAGSAGKGGALRTVGWVLGGVGVAGLGLGAVFGVLAIGDNKDAHCNASNQCLAGPLSSAKSAALGADVGLIAGGVLVASGAAIVIFGPRDSAPAQGTAQGTSMTLTPMIGAGSGGLSLRARW